MLSRVSGFIAFSNRDCDPDATSLATMEGDSISSHVTGRALLLGAAITEFLPELQEFGLETLKPDPETAELREEEGYEAKGECSVSLVSSTAG